MPSKMKLVVMFLLVTWAVFVAGMPEGISSKTVDNEEHVVQGTTSLNGIAASSTEPVPLFTESAITSSTDGVATSSTEGVTTSSTEGAVTSSTEGVATSSTEGVATSSTEGVATSSTEGVATSSAEGVASTTEIVDAASESPPTSPTGPSIRTTKRRLEPTKASDKWRYPSWDQSQLKISNYSLKAVGVIRPHGPMPYQLVLYNVSAIKINKTALMIDHPDSVVSLRWTNSGIQQVNGLPFKYLQELDVSHNEIEVIETLPGEYVRKLQVIDLSYNQLTYLGGFIYASNMRVIKLQHNNLVRLTSVYDLKYLHYVNYLDVSHNKIDKINSYDLIYNKNLRELYLNDNAIEHMHPDALEGNPHLERVSFENNKLRVIDNKTFTYTPIMEQLNLDGNTLEGLHDELFAPLKSLRGLQISGLPIKQLGEHVFNESPLLKELTVANTSVTYFPTQTIHQLYNLRVLKITKNKHLMKMEERIFENNKKLSDLDLSYNNISKIPKSVASLLLLKSLDLSGNRRLCSCESRWFFNWYRNQTAVHNRKFEVHFNDVCTRGKSTMEILNKLKCGGAQEKKKTLKENDDDIQVSGLTIETNLLGPKLRLVIDTTADADSNEKDAVKIIQVERVNTKRKKSMYEFTEKEYIELMKQSKLVSKYIFAFVWISALVMLVVYIANYQESQKELREDEARKVLRELKTRETAKQRNEQHEREMKKPPVTEHHIIIFDDAFKQYAALKQGGTSDGTKRPRIYTNVKIEGAEK